MSEVVKQKINCSMDNITVSTEPNKMVITGCMTFIGSPSDGVPCGGEVPIAFTEEAMANCSQTWVDMPLDAVLPDDFWDLPLSNHGYTNIGVCRKVWLQEDKCMGEFVVWKEKFPEVADMILLGMDALGFSIEVYPTRTHMSEDKTIEYIDEFDGSGCAVLWKMSAAFENTFIEKIAAKNRRKSMDKDKQSQEQKPVDAAKTDEQKVDAAAGKTEEPKQEQAKDQPVLADKQIDAMCAALDDFSAKIDAATAQFNELAEALKELADKKADDGVKASADDEPKDEEEQEEEEPTKVDASKKDVPAPSAVQHAVPNPALDNEVNKQSELDKINASAMSMMDKLVAISKLRHTKG